MPTASFLLALDLEHTDSITIGIAEVLIKMHVVHTTAIPAELLIILSLYSHIFTVFPYYDRYHLLNGIIAGVFLM